MNIDYLQKEIIPTREREIKEGKNLSTRQPIYVVLSMQENFISGHTDITPTTNYRGWDMQHGYVDEALDSECMEFNPSNKRMKRPREVTKFFTERIVAFFLTSEAANDYLKYQSHNLTDGYVYVFYSGYANIQMDRLLNNE